MMKVSLLKTTKVQAKGSKDKKLTPAGTEVDVTDAIGKAMIEDGRAIDPSSKVVAAPKNDEEIEGLKKDVIAKDKEIEALKAELAAAPKGNDDLLGTTEAKKK